MAYASSQGVRFPKLSLASAVPLHRFDSRRTGPDRVGFSVGSRGRWCAHLRLDGNIAERPRIYIQYYCEGGRETSGNAACAFYRSYSRSETDQIAASPFDRSHRCTASGTSQAFGAMHYTRWTEHNS